MGLFTQTIGKSMTHGFAGTYARQPDMIIDTLPAGGSSNIAFGTPLKLSEGKVVAMGSGDTGAAFVGIAGAEIKSALDYANQGTGVYAPNDPVAVFERGCINVKCQRGTPSLGAAVYVRVTANASYPTAVVGGFECAADDGKCVQLTNCAWAGAADANGVTELRILSIMKQSVAPAATTTTAGVVKQAAAVADAAGSAPTAAEYNALLAALRTAGIIAPNS